MTPVKRNQTWMPNLFNDFWSNDWFNILPARKSSNLPAMNIIENDNCFKIELAVPGITKEDFQISITNDNELVISVNKKNETEEKDKNGKYLRCEFGYTQFKQTLLLPENIDRDCIDAKQENGILYIEIKKKKAEKEEFSKAIEVK
jgi:HSP20 family protein